MRPIGMMYAGSYRPYNRPPQATVGTVNSAVGRKSCPHKGYSEIDNKMENGFKRYKYNESAPKLVKTENDCTVFS